MKVRYVVRVALVAFSNDTLRAYSEIVLACGGKFGIGEGNLCDFAFAAFGKQGTAKRLHALACEFDPRALLQNRDTAGGKW